MKKFTLPAVRLLLLSCLLFFFGCSKSDRLTLQTEVANLCPIRWVSFISPGGLRDTITFSYDGLGRPVSSMRTFTGSGSPKYLFRYDRKGHLQDFIGAYDNGAAEFWTRYTYSEDSRMVWDTTYTLTSEYTSWPPIGPSVELTFTHIKKYDQEGRVIQIFIPYIPPLVFPDTVITGHTQDIIYDAKGNAEGSAYDDKINYHQTNKVWMFIDDQYSVNNPFHIDEYDGYGLPVKFNFNLGSNTSLWNPILFGLEYPNVIIEYGCDLPKVPAPGE